MCCRPIGIGHKSNEVEDAGGGIAVLAGFDGRTLGGSFEPSRGVRVYKRGLRLLFAMIYA